MGNKRRPTHAVSLATPARKAALELVRMAREQECYLTTIAPKVLASHVLEPSDKAFARLLAQGALSLQVTLDALIDRALRSPHDIKPDVRDALRLSAYEILYLRKEDHAAVDQGVELVRSFAPRATGVANYVLHRVVEERQRFPYGDPLESLEAGALFAGFPAWLAQAVKKDIGTRNALGLMYASLEPAPVYLSVNSCAADRAEVERIFEDHGIEYSTDFGLMDHDKRHSDVIMRLVDRSAVGSNELLALLAEDKIVISDLSAQSIVLRAVDVLPETDARMLEIGAGRGTKTLQFQSACKDAGITLAAYDALDVRANKMRALTARIERAGGTITNPIVADATKPLALDDAAYDLVFIDAPCTGLGTLRRHPEIKARLEEGDSRSLAKIGQAMLSQAAGKVRAGGHLMYATCTILKEENEKTIKRFLASPAGAPFEVVAIGAHESAFFKTPIVAQGPDLHFAALLRKTC